jgi:hypothetical protein
MAMFLRVAVFWAILAGLIYICLYFYFRSGIKMRLEKDWNLMTPNEDRDEWVAARLGPRLRRLRWGLAMGVYGLPLITFAVIVYLTN